MTVPSDAGLAVDRQAAERARVALADPPLGDGVLDARSSSSRRRVFATVDRARPTRVASSSWLNAELVDQLAVGVRLLDRVEVRALEVLDERQLELLAIGELADDRRDALQAGQPRGADAALAGDELVAVEGLGDEDRLDDAVLADARGERLELGFVAFAGAADAGSAGSARAGSRSVPAAVGPRCGIRAARPRPRPCWRSGRRSRTVTATGTAIARLADRRGRSTAGARRARIARSSAARAAYASAPLRVRADRARSAGRGSAPRTGGRSAGSIVS